MCIVAKLESLLYAVCFYGAEEDILRQMNNIGQVEYTSMALILLLSYA